MVKKLLVDVYSLYIQQKQAFTPNQENKLFVYGTFSYVNSQYVLKVIRQKLQINGRAYILDDIFGIGESALTNNTQKSDLWRPKMLI